MFARASSIDHGRAAEAVAWASCAVLGALVLWLFVRVAWSLVPRGDAAFEPAPLRSGASAASPAAQSVARWHLFGAAPARPGSGPGAPASTLSLVLRGTFAGNDPKEGIAVIDNAGQGERAWRVGDEVLPGVRLAAVHADRVVLSRDGADETLALPRDTRLAPADVVRPTPARVRGGEVASPTRAAAPSATSAPSSAAPALTIDQVRRDPQAILSRVQVVPVLADGKLAGVRLSAGTDVSLLEQVGLQQGDVVTAVNGMAVDSVDRGRQIMDSLGNADSVRVTVLRNGKPTEVTVGLR